MSNIDGTSQAFGLLKDAFRMSYVDHKSKRYGVFDAVTDERLIHGLHTAEEAHACVDQFKRAVYVKPYWTGERK